MPRNIELSEPHWYVVSEAVISNPCVKDVETGKREKNEDGSCKNGKENPDWPEGACSWFWFKDWYMNWHCAVLEPGNCTHVRSTAT